MVSWLHRKAIGTAVPQTEDHPQGPTDWEDVASWSCWKTKHPRSYVTATPLGQQLRRNRSHICDISIQMEATPPPLCVSIQETPKEIPEKQKTTSPHKIRPPSENTLKILWQMNPGIMPNIPNKKIYSPFNPDLSKKTLHNVNIYSKASYSIHSK